MRVLHAYQYLGLFDGGLAGLFWSFIWTFLAFGYVGLNVAEMSSMYVLFRSMQNRNANMIMRTASTLGGQYYWVSRVVPSIIQRFLSYIVGWVSVLF
jgi:hypothetical protein